MSRSDLLDLSEKDLIDATSAGLVKRARRELDDGSLRAEARVDVATVLVEWSDGVRCTFEPGSSLHGKCTCPALGACRHLVRSVLYIQSHPDLLKDIDKSTVVAASTKTKIFPSVEDLLALDADAFAKRMGKTTVRKAKKMLASGIPVRVSDAERREVLFPSLGIAIRFPVGGQASFSACNCSEGAPCSHVVPALLVLRGENGDEQPSTETTEIDRADLNEAMCRTEMLLGDLVHMGLDGVSLAWSEAATTTALEIRKLGLGVPADLLEQLADHVEAELSRRGQPDPNRLRWAFAALSLRLHAWSAGTAKAADDDLIAKPGRHYWTAGARTLIGVGVRAWWGDEVSGITVYLLDLNTRQIVTTGTARPKEYEMSPASLAGGAKVLADCTARDLLGDHFTCSAARLTADCKIRLPADAMCEVIGTPVSWEVLLNDHGVSRWSILADRFQETFPVLESMHRPLVYWFRPKSFWPAKVRADRQLFLWPMLDEDGHVLTIAYRYSAERAEAFEELRRFSEAAEPLGVLGSLRWTSGEASVEPITFVHRMAGECKAFVVDIDKYKPKTKQRRAKSAKVGGNP